MWCTLYCMKVSNIPAAHACMEYVSFSWFDITELTRKLFNQWFHVVMLELLLEKFYFRHNDVVYLYRISVINDHGYICSNHSPFLIHELPPGLQKEYHEGLGCHYIHDLPPRVSWWVPLVEQKLLTLLDGFWLLLGIFKPVLLLGFTFPCLCQ